MPEANTAPVDTSSPGIDLDALVRRASAPLPVDTAKLRTDLTGIAEKEAAAKAPLYKKQQRQIQDATALAHQTYEGIKTPDVKPWDAQQEQANRIRTPMEDFGSFGTMFAIMASAFTRQPMINALNGAAAAMNAAQSNDEKAYDKAHQAWKENTDLALKRHEIQRQSFDDALKLFKIDAAAGAAEFEAVAARFGDQKKIAMIRANMIPEVIQVLEAEQKAAMGLAKAMPGIELEKLQFDDLRSDPEFYSDDKNKKQEALRKWHDRWRTTQERVPPVGTPQWFEWYQKLNAPEQKKVQELLRTVHPGALPLITEEPQGKSGEGTSSGLLDWLFPPLSKPSAGTGSSPQSPMPLPGNKSEWKPGTWYSTPQGVGKYTGKENEFISPEEES